MNREDPAPRGVKLKVWHIVAFMFALAGVMVTVRDVLSDEGLGWWTLLEVVVGGGIASAGVLVVVALAKRKAGRRPGGTA